jgi:hypothetical protein
MMGRNLISAMHTLLPLFVLLLIGLRASAATNPPPKVVASQSAPAMTAAQLLGAFAKGQSQWKSFIAQYEFSRQEDAPRGQPGTLIIRSVSSRPREPIELLDFCDSMFTHGLGVLLHDGGKRFDARMRPAASLRVRDRLEPAGWEPSPCYVLEANTAHGHYTVWLDDIRNGVQVFYPDQGQKRPGTWQNGQVVDEAGQVIFDIGITSDRRNQP